MSAVGNPVGMFDMLTNATSIDCTGLDTSQVNDMVMMFAECYKLTSVTFGSGFDTSQVTNMGMMFAGDYALTQLDLSGFTTTSVTNMSMMFYANEGLVFLDISGFDTSNVTDMAQMFTDCPSLRAIDFGDDFTFKNGDSAAFPELTEDDIYTGKWVPGPDPRVTEGAKTAAELMGTVVSPQGLWVAQMKPEAATQAWESLIPAQTTPDPAPDPDPNPNPNPDPEPETDPEPSDSDDDDDGDGKDSEGKDEEGDEKGDEKQDSESQGQGDDGKPADRQGEKSDEKEASSARRSGGGNLVQTGRDDRQVTLTAVALAAGGTAMLAGGLAAKLEEMSEADE